MEKIKVRLTLTEDILGTASGNKELYADYIATKAPTVDMVEQEVEDFDPELAMEKAMTIFPRLPDGTPFLYDYQIKGFFKDSAGVLRKIPKTACSKIKAYKKEIDGPARSPSWSTARSASVSAPCVHPPPWVSAWH